MSIPVADSKNEALRAGVLAALWTPGDVRARGLKEPMSLHLAFLRRGGVHGIFALGSTSGFAYYDLEERKRILETVAALADPLPVVGNISDIRSWAAADLGRFARGLGLSAVALMAPSYYPISQADLLAYFLRVSEAAQLPVILYNFPELAGKRIELDTIAAFADRAPMLGIKQSGKDFAYHSDLAGLGREKGFVVFSGAPARLAEAMALGATGCVGALTNLLPEYVRQVYDGVRAGSDVAVPQGRLQEVEAILSRLTFPLNIAAGLEARGFDPGDPKIAVSEASARAYAEVVGELREQFRQWGL